MNRAVAEAAEASDRVDRMDRVRLNPGRSATAPLISRIPKILRRNEFHPIIEQRSPGFCPAKGGPEEQVELVVNKPFNPYAEWLDLPPDLRSPNHYQLLQVAPDEDDPHAIVAAADWRNGQSSRATSRKTGCRMGAFAG